jgi:hypothetical protein
MINTEIKKMIEESQAGFSEEEMKGMCEEMNGFVSEEELKDKIKKIKDDEIITVILNDGE